MQDSNRNHFKWFILAGAFMTVLTAGGFQPTIGIFILEWQEEFHDVSTEQIGWIGGGFMAGYAIAGLLIATFSSWISCRGSIMFGGVIACICMSLIYLTRTSYPLFFLMTITGFGFGCAISGSLSAVVRYFTTNLGVVNGVMCSGGSFGLLLLPPLLRYLIEQFSWRGAMLVNGGIAANICVYGALYRSDKLAKGEKLGKKRLVGPPFEKSKTNSYTLTDTELCESEGWQAQSDIPLSGTSTSPSSRSTSSSSTSSTTSSSRCQRRGQLQSAFQRKSLSWSWLKHRVPILALVTNSRTMLHYCCTCMRGFGGFGAMVYFVSLAVDNNISKSRATFLLSLMGITGTTTRLTHGILLDRKLITPIGLQSLTLVIGGGSCIFVAAFPHSDATFTAYAVIFGSSYGIFNILFNNILRDIVETELIQPALSLALACECIGSIVAGPTLGALFDATHDYAASYYASGSLLIASGLLQLADYLLVLRQTYQEVEKDVCNV